MSRLLEEAIIEADALRESALRSAESAVIEKYSSQIREAVEQMLDQEGDFPGSESDEETEDILDQLPTSKDGDPEAPDDEIVELDLEQLKQMVPEMEVDIPELSDQALAEELKEDVFEVVLEETPTEELEEVVEERKEKAQEEEELDAQEDERLVNEIVEALMVDIEPVKNGWAGTPESQVHHKSEQLLASLQSDDRSDDFEAMSQAVKKLQKENKNLKESVSNVNKKLKTKQTQVKKLSEAVTTMKEILEESNVINAKLLYKVKTLESNSLNERQKDKIVGKLSEAKTVEEAKLIFETLQSSVGSTERLPESLSEAVERSSTASLIVSRNKGNSGNTKDPVTSRWKRLAGLTDKGGI